MNDVRYALRSLSRSKGFVAIAVISLALALGLNTSMFAVMDAFMHPYDPYRDSDRLMKVGVWGPTSTFDQLRTRTSFFESIAAYSERLGFVEVGSEGEQTWVSYVTPNFFTVLGVTPERGRIPVAADGNAVVISHFFWTRRLGRPDSLDTIHIMLDGKSVSVIGVMPPDLSYPTPFDMWQPVPESVGPGSPGEGRWDLPVVRLKPGVSVTQATLEVQRLAKQLMDESRTPDGHSKLYRAFAAPLRPNPYQLNQFHWALAGCAVLVLLIACANLANLMLARGVARRGELALRLAIGASRKALIRQLVTEAAILAAAGGALGTFLAAWGVNLALVAVPKMASLSLPALHLSWRMFAFGLLTTGITVVLFGFLPALRASDVDVAQPLKESAGTTTSRRGSYYSALAISQIALALVLVMAAAILGKSAYRFINQDRDYSRQFFNVKGLFGANLDLRKPSLPDAAVASRFQFVRDRVRTVSGVRSVATQAYHELNEGHVALSDDERNDSLPRMLLRMYMDVSPEYLGTLGIGIREGRDFLPGDRDVAIVSPGAAMRLWHNQSPVGRLIKLGPPHSKAPWIPVVGIIEDHTDWRGDPDLGPPPSIYVVPAIDTARNRRLIVRSDPSDPRVAAHVARELQSALLLPALPRVGATYRDDFAESRKLMSAIFAFIALAGLGLAATGLYSVLAHTVSLRMREFGIRMAVGANASHLYQLVMRDGTVMFLAGTALGAFAAMFAAQFIDHLLFEVEFTDVSSLVMSELILCAAAFLACLAPARRAMRADPVEILRAT